MTDRVVIEDDKIYYIPEFDVSAPGRSLKDPAFFQLLRFEHLIKAQIFRTIDCATRWDRNRAYQYSATEPRFIIFPEFPRIRFLVNQLRMPKRPSDIYYSLLLGGGQFVGIKGPSFQDFQKYSVELFGKKVDLSSRTGPRPSHFNCGVPPNYWRESINERIEIWRTRIFPCTPDKVGSSPSRPVTFAITTMPYLEAIWDAKLKQNVISFEGLENLHKDEYQEEFRSNTQRILLRRRPKGRPRGSGLYPITSSFLYDVEQVISDLWTQDRTKVSQEEVACELCLGLSNFKRKWADTKLRWDNFVATVIQRLTRQN
jgi:hypothetical protein